MEKIAKPICEVIYSGKNITAEISSIVISITYTDNLDGKSDDIQIVLSDYDDRFKGSWYPAKGDRLELSFGYEGDNLIPSGVFEIDEIEYSGAPDIVSIKALSTGINNPLRSIHTAAYDDISLKGVVEAVASRHNFTVEGIDDGIIVDRITQVNTSDLSFLSGLADKYGYAFVLRGDVICFYDKVSFFSVKSIYEITKDRCISYSLSDKTVGTVSKYVVTYYDQKQGNVIVADASSGVSSADVGVSYTRVSSAGEADAVARGQAIKALFDNVVGNITLVGNPNLVSGCVVSLSGWSALDGDYLIKKSSHTFDNGYITDIEVVKCPM